MKMQFIALLVFLLQAIINRVNLTIAQTPFSGQMVATCQTNDKLKSAILQNHRDSAFENLLKSIGSPQYTGYRRTQSGTGKIGEEVFARALCPPNVNVDACRDCINHTSTYLKQNCVNQKEGVAYMSLVKLDCIVHYSVQPIDEKTSPWSITKFASPTNEFIKHVPMGLNDLASELKEKAAGGDTLRKYASGSVVYGPELHTLYGSMQCVPDIYKEDCISCLNDAIVGAHKSCTEKGKVSGKCMKPNCYVRYSHTNYLPKNSWAVSANRSRENV